MSNLLYQPVMQLVDVNGVPVMGALAYFYATGTTTPQAIYEDLGNAIVQSQPIESDVNGLFPVVFFDPHLSYRMKLIMPGGDLVHPLRDIDPVAVAESALQSVDVETALGYTPVNPASAIFTAPARLSFATTPTALDVDDVGFRGIPRTVHDAAYVIELNDSATLLVKDDTSAPSWSLEGGVMPLGHWFDVLNVNTGNLTVNAIGNVTLQLAGQITKGTSAVVTEGGAGKFHQYEVDTWIIKGADGITVT